MDKTTKMIRWRRQQQSQNQTCHTKRSACKNSSLPCDGKARPERRLQRKTGNRFSRQPRVTVFGLQSAAVYLPAESFQTSDWFFPQRAPLYAAGSCFATFAAAKPHRNSHRWPPCYVYVLEHTLRRQHVLAATTWARDRLLLDALPAQIIQVT